MKRHSKRIAVGHEEFRNIRLLLQLRQTYFIAGHSSIFVPSRQEKYLMTHRRDGFEVCKFWPDLEGKQVLMSPGECARVELARAFPKMKRVGWGRGHLHLFDWRWPMLFNGPQVGTGCYIDLVGAYHQIYRRIWLDVAFPCGYGSLDLAVVAEKLAGWKAARNALVGITRSREVMGVKGFKTIALVTSNPYLSPHLWATIQAILNEVAFFAEALGAVYIATDGYIFPEISQANLFKERLYDWGFGFRSTIGEFDLRAWGSYRFRDKTTMLFRKRPDVFGQSLRSINIPDGRFTHKLTDWWSFSVPRYRSLKEGFNYDK